MLIIVITFLIMAIGLILYLAFDDKKSTIGLDLWRFALVVVLIIIFLNGIGKL